MVTGITGSLGSPLVPSVVEQEHVALSTAQWILTGPFLLGAVAAPVVGRLATGRRRRPVLLAVVAVATAGTVLAALPLGIAGMIAGRTVQGLAFAVSPLLFAIARDFLPAESMRSQMATLSVANVAAAGLGYPFTAAIVHLAGVPAAFWAGAVLMLLAFALAVVAVPGTREPPAPGVDLVGAGLLMSGFLSLLLVISRAYDWGATSTPTLLLGTAAVVLLLAAIRHFRRTVHPLVDLELATSRGVLGLHAAAVLVGAGAYVLLGSVMVFVQADPDRAYGLGLTIVAAGAMMLPYAAGSMAGNRVALAIGKRVRPTVVLPAGCLIFALANLMLAVWHAHPWQVVVAMALGGIGSGFTFNSVPWLMILVVPAEETGSAMGLNVVLRFVGFALGSALSSAVLEGLADAAGHPTQTGFVSAVVCGAAISLLAALVSSWLLRGTAETTPAVSVAGTR